MNSKHLTKGSSCPEYKDKTKMRIYTMRFCPYGQRDVLIAAAKGAQLDFVNVNIDCKPEWLTEKNPLGQIPILETGEGFLTESLVIAEYIDGVVDPNSPLQAHDLFKRGQDRVWAEKFSPMHMLWVKLIIGRLDEDGKGKVVKEITDIIAAFEKELERRGTTFFGGSNKTGYLDYMIWPWFERTPAFKILAPSPFDQEKHPNLDRWDLAMRNDPAVKSTIAPTDIHVKFIKSRLTGAPNYEIMHERN